MKKRKSRSSDMLLPLGTDDLKPIGSDDLRPLEEGKDMLLPLGDCPELRPLAEGVDELQTIADVIADLEKMGGSISIEGVQTLAEVAADLDLIATGTRRPRGANAATKRVRVRPLNLRQRRFARALASGVHPAKAQAIAGFKSHRGNACRMARDPRIVRERARIERQRRQSSRKRGEVEPP